MNDFYCESMPFEHFIRRVYLYDRTKVQKHFGVHKDMQNLMLTEQGALRVKHLGSYEKQLSGIKKRMNSAFNGYLKWSLTVNERMKFIELKNELELVHTTSQLMFIIREGIDLTQPYIAASAT